MTNKLALSFVYILLFFSLFTNIAYGEEFLSIDESSYVDINGQPIKLSDFRNSDQLLMEKQKIEAHIKFKKIASNPRDTYVLKMETDLTNPQWQFMIDEKIVDFSDKGEWETWKSQYHGVNYFEIIITGYVPQPSVEIEEPKFEKKGYTGKGPGLIKRKIARFKVIDEKIITQQEFVEYSVTPTNDDVKRYLNEINTNLNTSLSLPEEYSELLRDMRQNILKLSNEGHIGWALEMSKSFEGMVNKLNTIIIIPRKESNTVLIAVITALIAVCIGFIAGRKIGQGRDMPDIGVIKKECDNLKQNSDLLQLIDISNLTDVGDQGVKLEQIKRDIAKGTISLKSKINQLK